VPVDSPARSRFSCESGVFLYGPTQQFEFMFRLLQMVSDMSCVTCEFMGVALEVVISGAGREGTWQ